ncbi:hypothetical protein F6R97_30125 [Pseudomonas sp. JV414]|nr:hypothetical protein [Pseudomonas sp. JV414]
MLPELPRQPAAGSTEKWQSAAHPAPGRWQAIARSSLTVERSPCGSGLWRGGLPPFECVALTKSLVHQRFWGCFAAQRGQAPSPQSASTLSYHCFFPFKD